jgi:hypothetical protein
VRACLVVRAMHGRAVRTSVERKRGRVDGCKLHARLMQANHSVGGNCIQAHARIALPAGITLPPGRSVLQSEPGGELPACGMQNQSDFSLIALRPMDGKNTGRVSKA